MRELLNRGAFSIRKGKPADPERETRALWAELDRLQNASEHLTDEPESLALDAVHAVENEFNLRLPMALAVHIAMCLLELIDAAPWNRFEPDLGEIDFSGTEGLALRQELRLRIKLLSDEENCALMVRRTLAYVASHIIGRLANNPVALEAFASDHSEPRGLSIRIADYLDDLPEAMTDILGNVGAADSDEAGLFETLRLKLILNLQNAPGSHPKTGAVLPNTSKISDRDELIESYLGGTILKTLFEGSVPIALPDSARLEHCHILGGSGHGKTQLLSQLILEDLRRAKTEKRTVIVFDNQGDLISKILSLAEVQESSLADKLVIIDPTEFEYPIALNPFVLDAERMKNYSAADRERILHSAISLFEFFFGELLGADLTANQGAVFKFLIRLLIEIPGATLLTLRDMMDAPEKYRPHIQKLSGAPRQFLEQEFLSPSYSATRKQISKRLWAVFANPVFERLFSSPLNKLDWFSLMQDGHIILINTAKDFLKPEGSRLLGRFLMAQIGQGILERAVVSESERTPTFLYIDEAHDQIDDTIEMLLSQGRKYRLGLTLAHQHLDQLTPAQRSGLISNTSIKLAGGVSRKDASALSGDMNASPDFLSLMRKQRDTSRFALSVRHHINAAVALTVPLGMIDSEPKVSQEIVAACLARNRQGYGRRFDPDAPAHDTARLPAPAQAATPDAAPPRVLPGRGSPTHREEQERIRAIGQKLGYLARVEEPLPDGSGYVDVYLENANVKIAVEISVTTSAEHEVENLRKCVRSEFNVILSVSADARHTAAIKYVAEESFSQHDFQLLRFVTSESVQDLLKILSCEDETNLALGYNVNSKSTRISSSEKERRQNVLVRLLANLR